MTHDSSPPFQVAVGWDGVVATVTVTGAVDCTTAPALASRLLEVTAEHPGEAGAGSGRPFLHRRGVGAGARQRLQGLGETVPNHLAGAPALSHQQVFGLTGLIRCSARWVASRQKLMAGMTGRACYPSGACSSPEAPDAQRLLVRPEHTDPGDTSSPARQPGIPRPPDGQPAGHRVRALGDHNIGLPGA
jgi:hypothetical protein